MYWKISDLDSDRRQKLNRILQDRRLDSGWYYLRSLPSAPIVVYLVLGLALGYGAFVLFQHRFRGQWDEWFAMSIGYSLAGTLIAASLLEAIRRKSSSLKPYLLLTPKVLVKVDYDHGYIEAFRLKDANDFKMSNKFGSRSLDKVAERQYAFFFPEAEAEIVSSEPRDMKVIEAILEQAKSGALEDPQGHGLDLIPAIAGIRRVYWREFTRPHVWLAGICLMLVAMFLLALMADAFRWI